jgi:hypothetical protein
VKLGGQYRRESWLMGETKRWSVEAKEFEIANQGGIVGSEDCGKKEQ